MKSAGNEGGEQANELAVGGRQSAVIFTAARGGGGKYALALALTLAFRQFGSSQDLLRQGLHDLSFAFL